MTSPTIDEQPLFANATTRRSFPAPIAETLDEMVSEITESGEATTADETALAIEATLVWLGRVWVAEYLRAIGLDSARVDEALNRDIYELAAASHRPPSAGQWVGMARRARAALHGHATVVAGLAVVDFEARVAALLDFRNHFSHGSFASTIASIRTHRQLLHDLLSELPALRTQVPRCCSHEGVTVAASGAWGPAETPPGEPLAPYHPVIVGEDGARLDLYPLVHASHTEDGWALRAPGSKEKTHPIAQLTQVTAFAAWSARYDRERNGHLAYAPRYAAADLADALADALRGQLEGLVLIEAPPGARGGAAVAALDATTDPAALGLGAFAAVRRVRVVPGDLSQSGVTLARTVLRLTEEALGDDDGVRDCDAEGARWPDAKLLAEGGPVARAAADLAAAGVRALLGIEDLHHGATAYRREPITVRDVYEGLAGTAFTVVATTHTGSLPRILFDRRVRPPLPRTLDDAVLDAWLRTAVAERPLHLGLLRALTAADAPAHLFVLCDALESGDGPRVYEPAVERALWDLQPVLTWSRVALALDGNPEQRVRVWSPLFPSLAQAVARLGGAS